MYHTEISVWSGKVEVSVYLEVYNIVNSFNMYRLRKFIMNIPDFKILKRRKMPILKNSSNGLKALCPLPHR